MCSVLWSEALFSFLHPPVWCNSPYGWILFLNCLMAGSHMQSVMRDFVHLLIHFGGIKPSTRCDGRSVALVSNVQCWVTAMLVENHQIVPCWYAGLSQRMCQLSKHMCSKKSSTADFKWFIYLFETELRSTGTAHHFAYLLNTTDYRILRMDEDYDRMYIGSKDHILSLDLHDINKDPHIVRSFSHSHSTPPLTPNSGPSNGLLEQDSATSAAPRAKCSVQLLQTCPETMWDSWKWLYIGVDVGSL